MKDRPRPSSYGSVYIPPHHRLRSVITSSASSPNISSPPVTSKTLNVDQNSFGNSKVQNTYSSYLPNQHQKKVDEVSEEGSDRELDFSGNPGASTRDNIDSWKWKLSTLVRNKDKQELVSREKKDRRDYEQIATLASRMGLHSHLYAKVVVVSKVPLPNYRFDLDDKRPQREVILPPGLQRRVDTHLGEYLSQKSRSMEGVRDNLFSRTSSNGSLATDEGLFEQPEPLPQSKAALEKILWRRSLQQRTEQQAWQESPEGLKMLEFRRSLPAYKEKDAILTAISQNQVKLVVGRRHRFPSSF